MGRGPECINPYLPDCLKYQIEEKLSLQKWKFQLNAVLIIFPTKLGEWKKCKMRVKIMQNECKILVPWSRRWLREESRKMLYQRPKWLNVQLLWWHLTFIWTESMKQNIKNHSNQLKYSAFLSIYFIIILKI